MRDPPQPHPPSIKALPRARYLLCHQVLALPRNLVQQLVEVCIVRPDLVVSELVEHGAQSVLPGKELGVTAVGPQPDLNLRAAVDVQPEERRIRRAA